MITQHAIERAVERFKVGARTMQEAAKHIAAGDATFVCAEHEREIWLVTMSGRELPIVYDPKDQVIVTVLPRHSLKELHKML